MPDSPAMKRQHVSVRGRDPIERAERRRTWALNSIHTDDRLAPRHDFGAKEPSLPLRISRRIQREMCFGLQQIQQTAHSQVAFERLAFECRDRATLVALNESIHLADRTAGKLPAQDRASDLGSQIPLIRRDNVSQDICFSHD